MTEAVVEKLQGMEQFGCKNYEILYDRHIPHLHLVSLQPHLPLPFDPAIFVWNCGTPGRPCKLEPVHNGIRDLLSD